MRGETLGTVQPGKPPKRPRHFATRYGLSVASMLIAARTRANLTKAEVAESLARGKLAASEWHDRGGVVLLGHPDRDLWPGDCAGWDRRQRGGVPGLADSGSTRADDLA